jgi:hypothetical protein
LYAARNIVKKAETSLHQIGGLTRMPIENKSATGWRDLGPASSMPTQLLSNAGAETEEPKPGGFRASTCPAC